MRIDSACIICLVITGIIILIPMIWGLVKWKKLPDTLAIHFGVDKKPNGFASKRFVVIVLPILLLLVQLIVFFAFTLSGTVQFLGMLVFVIVMLIVPAAGTLTFVIIFKRAIRG